MLLVLFSSSSLTVPKTSRMYWLDEATPSLCETTPTLQKCTYLLQIEEGVVVALQDHGVESGIRVEATAGTLSSLRKQRRRNLNRARINVPTS